MICASAEGRPAFRVGARDRNGREHSEDGADDHSSEKQARSLCGKTGQAQSPSGEALANGGAMLELGEEVSKSCPRRILPVFGSLARYAAIKASMTEGVLV